MTKLPKNLLKNFLDGKVASKRHMELYMVSYDDRNHCHAILAWSKWNGGTNIQWKSIQSLGKNPSHIQYNGKKPPWSKRCKQFKRCEPSQRRKAFTNCRRRKISRKNTKFFINLYKHFCFENHPAEIVNIGNSTILGTHR